MASSPVAPAAANTTTVSNTASINIPDNPSLSALYPSPITISGTVGQITLVTLTLHNLSIGRPRDLDMMLVGPGGQQFVFLSDVGGTAVAATTNNVTITIDDAAATFLPGDTASTTALVSGTFRPTNNGAGEPTFPTPAPTGTNNYAANNPNGTPSGGTSTFQSVYAQPGVAANGVWNLYVYDDAAGGASGTIAGGWTLNVTTDNVATQPPPAINVSDASLPEPASGSANMPFVVALSGPSASTVTVGYTVADGTAKAAEGDYSPTSGTLTFNPGETVQTISVPVLADANAGEADENFTVTLSAPVNGTLGADVTATGTIAAAGTPGRVLISELRTSGPGGALDDFVELYNNQDVAQDISGWALVKMGSTCGATPVVFAVIPAATTLQPRRHYLIVGQGYGLTAAADRTFTGDVEADRNLALFNISNLTQLSTATREDAVGFDVNAGGGNNCDLLREGATLASALGSTSQHSFARHQSTGLPKETNDNAADFRLVSTTPAVAVGNNPTPTLGAPGPENTGTPIQRNGVIKSSLIDGTVASSAPPNRVRSSFGANPTNAAFGTLSIQRRFKNTTGAPVTQLRFRIVELTTLNNRAAGQADLRVLGSNGVVTDSAGNTVVTVTGLALEGPAQSNGGGLNSSLAVVLPGGGLAPDSSIDVQFLLGVQEQGAFSFLVNVEALPGAGTLADGATGAMKAGRATKQRGADAGGAASRKP